MATFKKEYPDLVESVITECDIYSSVGKRFHTDRALWDTGADTTIISSRIAKQLQLSCPYPTSHGRFCDRRGSYGGRLL